MASRTPTINGKCQCGRCQNALVVQGPAKGGQFPGQHFLHVCIYSASIIVFPAIGITHFRWHPHPNPPYQWHGTKTVDKCSGTVGCKRNAHGSCGNFSCKRCCILQGGCRVREHKAIPSSGTQHPASTRPSSFAPTSTITIDPSLTFDDLAQQLSDAAPFRQLQLQDEIRAENDRKAAEREAELDRQEEEEFQKALAASPLPVIESTLGSTSSQSIHTSQQATPATPSPSLLISGIPVTRVTAANKPTITTQMAPNWMRAHEDKTQQPRALTGRGQLDVEIVQRFRVIWWAQSKKAPVIFIVQTCPQWPKWRITDCANTVKRVGDETLEFYDLKHHIWLECPVSCPHLVKTDGYFLLRRAGVICEDFDGQLDIATRPPTTSRVYMSNARQSVKTKVLKRKGKARALDNGEDSEGEVVIVGPPIPSKYKKIKREPDIEIVFWPARPLLSPLRTPGLSPSGMTVSNPISILDSPLVSPSLSPWLGTPTDLGPSFRSLSAVSSRSINPISAIPVSATSMVTTSLPASGLYDIASPLTGPPPMIPGSASVWPSNMYVIDMVYGFRKMDELLKANRANYDDRFDQVFGQQPPHPSTYHDQVKRWAIAPTAIREAALSAQRTGAGHWTRFAKLVPLKK
ncbi:hypothetical protein BDZ97DRAFT_1659645 [Flammula alnicola]|nr:hypothetical protein BDZ97DRAFT_1659645 [Flammula alnicola]